jgi:hypothetical protein
MDVERKPGISGVEEIPEQFPEIPEDVEAKESPQATKTKFDANVEDDNGRPILETPETREVTITIPTEMEKIEQLSKGSTDDSITWWAKFYVRSVAIALKKGWQVIFGKITH